MNGVGIASRWAAIASDANGIVGMSDGEWVRADGIFG